MTIASVKRMCRSESGSLTAGRTARAHGYVVPWASVPPVSLNECVCVVSMQVDITAAEKGLQKEIGAV